MKSSILIAIDDNQEILLSLRVVLGKHFKEILCFAQPSKEVEQVIAKGNVDVVLLDMNFTPGATSGAEGLAFIEKIKQLDKAVSVVPMTAYGDIDLAVNAMKLGATDFVVKPWENKKLLATVGSACNLTQSKRELTSLKETQEVLSSSADLPFAQMIGESDAMKKIFKAIEKVASTDANVLILGENGTGKELVARAIHRLSPRADKLFLSVDMGSIAESLFESELFGHIKGAFTDAKENRAGRFEAANGGTLFLDEIANIPQTLQAKLLSVLQTRTVTRVGSSTTKEVDIRLISATNANIGQLVESGSFRQDLYYRINTIEISLPPLRDRDDDIFLLAEHFLSVFAQKYGRSNIRLSKSALRLIKSYHWPGNIRELLHALERAVIMSDGNVIESEKILYTPSQKPKESIEINSLNIEDVEKKAIIQSLKLHRGNVSLASRELGMGRTTLYRKMQKYGL